MTTLLGGETSQQSLSRKQSTRRLSRPEHLGSSEMTPSEHSSLYDAVPLATASRRIRSLSWSEDAKEDEQQTIDEPGGARGRQQADAGKHVGTKLFTIIEQRSVPSLEKLPSNREFQRRVFSLQPQVSTEIAQARHSRVPRRRCYSADDYDPNVYRGSNKSDSSNATGLSGAQSPERQSTSPPTLPVEPPFRPPERMQTPTGLPRWPGEMDHDQFTVRQLTVRTSRRDLMREYLRRPTSRPKLREVLRGERTTAFDRDVRTGSRFWRPPSSGHTSRRYEDLETHPFSFVPIANPRGTTSLPRGQPVTEDERHCPISGPSGGSDRKVQDAANRQQLAVRDSLQALSCADQNAVPVSPRRASAQAGTRSAAVPSHVRVPPVVQRDPNETSQSFDTSTMRTVDLFESFPSPPGLKRRRQQTPKRCSWSLFPTSGRRGSAEVRQARSPPSHDPAGSDESGGSNVAIRGESRARYRQSGTPIYDPDGASLRTVDREREHSNESDNSVAATFGPRLHSESQRAISNGALRFSSRSEVHISDTLLTQPQNTENSDPKMLKPHHLCKHKLAKLHRNKKKRPPFTYDVTNLDGTSTPIPPPRIVAQDYALGLPHLSTQARSSTAPVPHLDRPPTTTTFTTAPNGATTFTTSPTMGPFGHPTTLASAGTSLTMPGRA